MKCVLDLFLSKAMAGKLRIVTEQKTLCKNLTTLQKSMVWIHQQQCGLALRTMSKGTQTRLAQIPEQARFLMNLEKTEAGGGENSKHSQRCLQGQDPRKNPDH